MSLTIVNRNDNSIVGEISNKNGLISAMYRRKKENDEMSLDIELVYTDSHMIRKGNSIVIEDEVGKLREFDIDDYEEIDGEVVVANCLPTYINDLGLSKPISKTRNLNSLATEELLNNLLSETNWQSGNIFSAGSLPFERDKHEYPLDLIKRLAEQRQLVADYYVEISYGRVTSRKVDLRLPEVVDNGKEVRRGKDLNSLKRRESLVDTRTAVQVIGSRTHTEIDDEGNEVEVDTELVVEVFNDEIQNKIGRPGDYKWDILESDSDNEEDMVVEGNEYLQRVSKVYEEFEIDVEDLSSMFPHENVQFGDVVHLKDTRYNPVLVLKGEIVEVEYDLSDESTKKYLIGEAVRLKTRIDDIEDVVDKYSVQLNQANDSQRKIIDRLVDIGGHIEGVGEEVAYKNELLATDIGALGGSSFSNFNYNSNLKVSSKSGNIALSNLGGELGTSGYGLVRVEKRDLGKQKAYTIRFRVKPSINTPIIVAVREVGSIPYVLVDGNRIGEDKVYSTGEFTGNVVIDASSQGWKTVEIPFITRYEMDRYPNPVLGVDLGIPLEGVDVEFEDFVIFSGTPVYGERNQMDVTSFVDTPGGQLEMEVVGGSYVFNRVGTQTVLGTQGLGELVLKNPTGDVSVKNIVMKVKIESGGFSGIGRVAEYMKVLLGNPATGNFGSLIDLGGGNYAISSEDEIVGKGLFGVEQVITRRGISIDEYPLEFEINMLVTMNTTTDARMWFGIGFANDEKDLRVTLSGIRVYEGVAPIGVDREGAEGEKIPDLTNELGRLDHKISQKANKEHSHSLTDLDNVTNDLEREVDSLGYAKTEDVEKMTWGVERVTGLTTTLNNKSNVGHGHLISEIDGLQEVLDILAEREGVSKSVMSVEGGVTDEFKEYKRETDQKIQRLVEELEKTRKDVGL